MDSPNTYWVSVAILIITYLIYQIYWKTRNQITCLLHEGIPCKIATTSNECIDLINELQSFQPKIVGFDIEWSSKKEDKNKKVSLIQLAHKKLIILFRINLIKNIPIELYGLLGNVEILKTGIGIFADKIKLETDYGLDVNGCIDINHIFNNKLSIQQQNKLKANYYQKNVDDLTKDELNNSLGLQSMSMLLLNRKMKYKNIASYRFHDEWNDETLNQNHIHYAADDALVGYEAFISLINTMINEKSASIDVNDLNPYISICDGLIDIKKLKKQKQKPSNIGTHSTQQNKVKKERYHNNINKWVNPNHFFTNNDKFSCCNYKTLELRYNNLIKFQLSQTKYKRNMNQLREELNLKTINYNYDNKKNKINQYRYHILWQTLFAFGDGDDNKQDEHKEYIVEDLEEKKEMLTLGSNENSTFYSKCKHDILYLNSTAFDTRIYVNTAIDLKLYVCDTVHGHELGILIKTSMSGNNVDVGAWNIGFVLGSNIFAYHPGYDKKSIYGAVRCEGVNGWKTESMTFIPNTDKMQHFEIFINQKSHIYLKITEDENEYIRDWQHRDSLFMDDECSVLIPCCFGIRIENSKGNKHKQGRRRGRYGDIQINVAQKDLKNSQILII